MPKPPKKTDRLAKVLKITLGEQAQERKKYNDRPQPGDVRLAKSKPIEDRLSRAIKKAQGADLKKREEEREGRPHSGEIYEAESPISEEQRKEEAVRRFLRTAIERFKLAAEAEAHSRSEALDDLMFRIGEQWPKDIQMSRELDGRPCLKMNRLPAIIRQVVNEQRQRDTAIKIDPVGEGADIQTAEILTGICRHIEMISDAEDISYIPAFEAMVTTGGWAGWRVNTEVIDEESNQQEIKIAPLKNGFQVYWDPASTHPNKIDARYAFIIEDLPKSEYDNLHPESQAATLSEFSSVGDNAPEWATRDTIRVAEYFYKDEDEDIYWAKINAIEVLEGNEDETAGRKLPGKYIPIVWETADDLDVNGKRHVAGLVRHAKDPQRMYNYWTSAATEMIALAPKAPFVGAAGQFENQEAKWRDANVRSLAYLEYNPTTDASGSALPPPNRNQFEPPVQSMNMMIAHADMDLKAVTGLFDPSLGQGKTDQSGRAIQSLQQQGNIATLNFGDNHARAIRHTGRIIVDLIPHIYDAARIQRIIKPDGAIQHVIVHNNDEDGANGLITDGIDRVFDVGLGRYDVVVSTGPRFEYKRQEAVAGQIALVQAYPNVFPLIGDMLVKNMDWPQAREMADRLKKSLPPQLLDDNTTDPQEKITMLTAQLQQLTQQNQQMGQVMQQQHDIINGKVVENQGKLQIAQIQAQSAQLVARINAQAKELAAAVQPGEGGAEVWQELHGAAHDLAMQHHQQQHDMNMKSMELAHEQAMSQAEQAHERGMAQQEHQNTLEQGEQSGQQAIQQIKAKPKPKPSKKVQ